jgi:mannose-6-phosphate isomerase
MLNKNYGGNIVTQLTSIKNKKTILSEGPYEYFVYETLGNEQIQFDPLGSCSLFVLEKSSETNISVGSINLNANQGDRIQIENCQYQLKIIGGPIKLLIAGTRKTHPTSREITLTRYEELYKVVKPWGYELWINNQHPNYAFKEIYIRAGHKTSLQYHQLKKETNVLLSGVARLHYNNNLSVEIDKVSLDDVLNLTINPISIIDVPPLTLHRLEAITDITLYEVSTPHLDDVIRISDDTGRANGRINNEHIKSV